MAVSRTFAQRLKTACDDHSLVPPYGLGRQVFIAQKIGVSQEAVRKWFQEESVPRREKIQALADLLDVDEAWLALGVESNVERKEKRALAHRSDGAIYLVYGWITVMGGHVAFPREKDNRREYVDFYAIVGGVQEAIHVSTGRETGAGTFEFMLPREVDDVKVMGFVHQGGRQFKLLDLSAIGREQFDKRGSGYSVTVKRDGAGFKCGSRQVPMIEDLKGLG